MSEKVRKLNMGEVEISDGPFDQVIQKPVKEEKWREGHHFSKKELRSQRHKGEPSRSQARFQTRLGNMAQIPPKNAK